MVALMIAVIGPALACTVVLPERLRLAEDDADRVPPPPPEVLEVDVVRGRGPRPIHCGYGATVCDDVGLVRIDTALSGDAVGLEVVVVDGEPPDGLSVPDAPVEGDHVVFVWHDGAGDEQEPIGFTVVLRALDRAGNASEAVEVEVFDAGRDVGSTCSHAPGAGLAALGLAWAARRRRAGTARPTRSPRRDVSSCTR